MTAKKIKLNGSKKKWKITGAKEQTKLNTKYTPALQAYITYLESGPFLLGRSNIGR